MKISAKQYAQCLYELVHSTPENETKEILTKFVALLAKQRALNLVPEIISNFSEIWSREQGELIAQLTLARDLNNEAKDVIINYLKNKSGAREVVLNSKVDKNILGGFVLKYNDKIIDGSLKSSLVELKNSLIA